MAAECDSLVLRTTDDGRRIEERVASATIIDEKCTWRIGAESRCATWIVERDREFHSQGFQDHHVGSHLRYPGVIA